MQWMRLMMALKRMGMLGVSGREMKALTLKVETVMVIGECRYLTCFMH